MPERLTSQAMSRVLKKALVEDIINDDDTAAVFYDLSGLDNIIKCLKASFPSDTLHAIAIKANPIIGMLRKLNAKGIGAEAASLPELYIAQKAGFSSERLVFDSPAKTKSELEYALKAGVHINIDSFEELEIITNMKTGIESPSSIGLRINPQVGAGKIKTTSVAGKYSKFGIPLKPNRKALIEAYKNNSWLGGVHLHIGSQGCSLEMLVAGVRAVLDFALEINSKFKGTERNQAIDIFDIGGGLPAIYRETDSFISIEQYSEALNSECPELFDGQFRLITEFGRHIHANIGWAVSRVERVKNETSPPTLINHLGADMFIRECYNPDDWYHDISACDSRGELKDGKTQEYMIAGPLCFAGDMLARNIKLPEMYSGDYILIHDCGAYTMSMWSRYNSRVLPKVIGYYNDGDKFEILKKREILDKVLDFWN